MTPEEIIQKIRSAGVHYSTDVLQLCDAYEALRAKVEAMEKDAARYRWLREASNRFSNRWPHVSQYPQHSFDPELIPQMRRPEFPGGLSKYRGEYLDETIDAALSNHPADRAKGET